jgi:thiol-disulfide isomerase/thioredoxin
MRLIIIMLVALALGGVFLLIGKGDSVPVDSTVPDVTLTLLNGESRSLHSYGGKTILLHFWATWCAPCVAEFPRLMTLAKEHPDWQLILVSADEKPEVITPFMQKMEVKTGISMETLPNVVQVWDKGKTISQETFQTVSYPETIVISPNLQMRDKIVGQVTPEHIR